VDQFCSFFFVLARLARKKFRCISFLFSFFRSLSPSAAVMQHRDRIGYFQSGSIGFPVISCQRSTDRFYLYLLLKPPSVLASTSQERNVSGHLIVHPESQPISYANYGWLMPDFRRPISIVNFYKSVRHRVPTPWHIIIIQLRLALPHRYTFLGYYMMMIFISVWFVLARVQKPYKECGWSGQSNARCSAVCNENRSKMFALRLEALGFKLPVERIFNCY